MLRPSDQDRAAAAMRTYRRLGYNPLPSRSDRKQPKVAFKRASGWDQVGPESWLDVPCRNVQVMTGVPWRLAAIDLDGPTAIALWEQWTLFRPVPPTWRVTSDPARGMHLWFTLPDGLESCPRGFLWRLDGEKHAAIEVIGDRSLITAPPSRHVKTGRRYHFLPGSSPRSVPRPAPMPGWLLDRVAATHPVTLPDSPPAFVRSCRTGEARGRFDTRAVIAAIPDKAAVARGFSLRIVGDRPNPDGWVECRAIGREDRTPSASFNVRSGFYRDHRDNLTLSLFEVAVATGRTAHWTETLNLLGDHYAAPPRPDRREQARQHDRQPRAGGPRP